MLFADTMISNEFDNAMTNVNSSGNNIHARSRTNSMNMEHFNAHGPKKPRSGSISGRLRTATDLEETGLIDKTQKGIIKDLIISGDQEIYQALDTYYEKGDTKNLQNMISDGYLRRKSVDILDGLDLDFLNVDQGDMNRFSLSSQNEILFDIDELNVNMGITFDSHLPLGITHNTTTNRKPSLSMNNSNGYNSINNASNNLAGSFNLPMEGDLNFDSYDILSRKFSLDDTLSSSLPFDDYLGNFAPLTFTGENKIDISNYTNLARSLQKEGRKSGGGIGAGFEKEKKKKSIKKENSDSNTNGTERGGGVNQQKANNKISANNSQNVTSFSRPYSSIDANLTNYSTGVSDGNNISGHYDAINDVYVMRNRNSTEGGPTVHSHFAIPGDTRGYIGAYSPEGRKARIDRFNEKRNKRVWTKKVKYDVRKNFADSRIRVKGRFVKKEDEELIKDLQDL